MASVVYETHGRVFEIEVAAQPASPCPTAYTARAFELVGAARHPIKDLERLAAGTEEEAFTRMESALDRWAEEG